VSVATRFDARQPLDSASRRAASAAVHEEDERQVVGHAARVDVGIDNASADATEQERPARSCRGRRFTQRRVDAVLSEQATAKARRVELGVGVMNHVGLAMEQCAVGIAERHEIPERCVDLDARHRVHPDRVGVLGPRREQQRVVRKARTHHVGDFVKHLPHVEGPGHGVEESASCRFALPRITLDDRIVLEASPSRSTTLSRF
jgi:hypothetical protein